MYQVQDHKTMNESQWEWLLSVVWSKHVRKPENIVTAETPAGFHLIWYK